ncbi:MAG TPA: hypothetical protein VEH06_07060 [Candidatus Bathyarchaeia archaeon]|jgi:hypothetical protein|nr:hypothetical protein [Candidatus Bathyarchaeia archaeon]
MKSVNSHSHAQLSHKLLLFDVLDRDDITENADENISIDIEPQQKVFPVRGVTVGVVILFIIS